MMLPGTMAKEKHGKTPPEEIPMPVLDHVKISPGAWISFSTLPDPEREHIMVMLSELAAHPPERWPEREVLRLSSEPPLYMVHANDELRVVFRREEGGELTIGHIFLQEMLDRYFPDADGKKP
jgi:hypothetical protein